MVQVEDTTRKKTTKWPGRPATTRVNLGIRLVWSESSLCAQWVAKDPSFLHADSEDSDQTGWMPGLKWVFAGCTCHIVIPRHTKSGGVLCYTLRTLSVRPSVIRPSVRANIRGLGASLSMIMRFIPLRTHWVALKPIFVYVLGATSLWEFNMEVAHKPKMLERPSVHQRFVSVL